VPSPDRPPEPDYRFTLANERTFLAYERTAIGLVAAAVAVFNLLEAELPERALGVALLLAGAVAAVGGYLRYQGNDRAIRAGEPLPAAPVPHVLAATIVVCLLAAALTVLV
jgi:putative membrane protein